MLYTCKDQVLGNLQIIGIGFIFYPSIRNLIGQISNAHNGPQVSSYAALNKKHGIKCCAFSDEIFFANWMHTGWLLRKEKGREEVEGGRQLHLEILGVKRKILRVARVYMIQLRYKYC